MLLKNIGSLITVVVFIDICVFCFSMLVSVDPQKCILVLYTLKQNLKIKIYRTIILPVVLYGCETWSLTLREERGLRVFENRVLRRVFGPTRDDVTGEWRKLHKEELNDLYSLPNIVRVVKSRRMKWAGHVVRMGEDRRVHRVLVRKPEEKRPRRRW
jgi:hypothetical protein